MPQILMLHIVAGGLGLLAGAVALYALKGGSVHRRSGSVFLLAMLAMALSGALIAAIEAKEASIIAGLLAAYLVATGVTTLRARSLPVDAVLMAGGLLVGVVSLLWATDAVLNGGGFKDGKPAAVFVVFGSVALVGSGSDLRLIRGEAVTGARRIRRHLWRMCVALCIASAAFFLGQADELPAALRIYPLLATLAFLPLGLMAYWLWRAGPIHWTGPGRRSEGARTARTAPSLRGR